MGARSAVSGAISDSFMLPAARGHATACFLALAAQRAPEPRCCAPRWFDPCVEFGLAEPRPEPASLPLLLVLPGLDGSGVTAWTQYPELALSYEVRALAVPPSDRSTWAEYVALVSAEVDAAAPREVFLLGESMGSGLALEVATRRSPSLAGLVLVSPASSWDETWLGRSRRRLVALPDALLLLVIGLSSYQLLDAAQLGTTCRRILTGEKASMLSSPGRLDYAWAVVKQLPTRLASPAGTVRHRIAAWAEPSMAAAREPNLGRLATPTLIVAGTADLRTPAAAEARRIQAVAPSEVSVHLVEGAGHAGVTDDRVCLRTLMERWRRGSRI